jgi:DNA-binding transcriptional ArsR family regulator
MPGKKKESTSRPAGLEQMRALSHPLRVRLLELFAECPRTTKQAAEALGEAPTKLYHHVAALERAGLVRLRETRQNRGTTEKYFEVTQSQLVAKADAAVLQDEAAQAAIGVVLFDQAREELVRALSSGPEPRTVVAVRGILRLSRSEAKRLRKELVALLQRASKTCESDARSRTKRRRYTLTIALLPAEWDGGER